jgi:DNA-binding XRE family transcriptional regulator
MAHELTFGQLLDMARKSFYAESELGALAKDFRTQAGRSKAEVGRQLEVSRPSMQDAEERPERSLTRLRQRIIEACSPYRVEGPFYRLVRK